MSIRIPVYKPSIGEEEKELVLECIDSTWISSKGKYIDIFEENLASFIEPDPKNQGQAIAVCNGTVALHLAMLALGITRGDEVIVPSFTYIASSNCIEYVGATPVFADCNKDDWGILAEDIPRLVTPRTKAVICVHLYGNPTDARHLREICEDYNLFLIEDCAESIGASIHNIQTGSYGHLSTYSFFGNKTITTGEGGAIYTKDKSIYERALKFKSQGLSGHREYWHDVIGHNFRMTNIAAAIGVAQLRKLAQILSRKREIDNLYRERLSKLGCTFQKRHPDSATSAWMTAALFPNEKIRDHVRLSLRKKGIETRPTFFPVHTMPMYANKYYCLKNTEEIACRGVNLPSYPDLNNYEIVEICAEVESAMASLS